MTTRHWLVSAIGAIALSFMLTPAQAAPLGGASDPGIAAAVTEGSAVQQTHWRRRHWGWRHRHYYGGGYPYYYDRPYYGRRYYYGYGGPRLGVWGPGFGFSVGPRHRYWW